MALAQIPPRKKVHLPNLLLAGAPKCGTSSVYDWLTEHPEVSGGVSKELFYLVDPSDSLFSEHSNWAAHGDAGYQKYFPCSNKWLIDGTTISLYQESALQYASQHQPNILIFVREPSQRIYSLFKYYKNNQSFLEEETTFKEFIDLITVKNNKNTRTQIKNAFIESRYVDYIDRWVSTVGREKVKVYCFKCFFENPEAGITDICDWLGLDSSYFHDFNFPIQNESIGIKNRNLNKLKQLLAPKHVNYPFKNEIRQLYYRLNSYSIGKFDSQSDTQLLSEVAAEFTQCNSDLFRKYGVGNWN